MFWSKVTLRFDIYLSCFTNNNEIRDVMTSNDVRYFLSLIAEPYLLAFKLKLNLPFELVPGFLLLHSGY